MATEQPPIPNGPPTSTDSRVTTLELVARSTDMDADQVVGNAVFFQYFEQSRLEHLLRLGVIRWPPTPGGEPRQFTLVETTARFRAPAVHRDRLLVTTRTVAVGSRSFTLAYAIDRADSTRVCDGTSVQVWLDSQGHSAPLPDSVRARLMESLT